MKRVFLVFLLLSLMSGTAGASDKVRLKEKRDTITSAVITGIRSRSTLMGHSHIPGKMFQARAVMTTPDLIKTLQTLPGVSPGTEMTSGLYVRGGTGADNLYMIDDVPLYQSGHFLGLYSSFNTDVINSVDFYRGPFPARYSGRISSVVNAAIAEGSLTGTKGQYSLSPTDGRFQIEGPMKKKGGSYNLALRLGWIEAFLRPLLNFLKVEDNYYSNERTRDGDYGFADLNAKLCWRPTSKDKVSLNLYGGYDLMAMNFGSDATETSHWGNALVSSRWDHSGADNLDFDLTTYFTDGFCDLIERAKRTPASFDGGVYKEIDYIRINESNFSNFANLGTKFNARQTFGWNKIGYGANLALTVASPGRRKKERTFYKNGGTSSTSLSFDSARTSFTTSVYLEDEMTPLEWLTATAGLNFTAYTVRHAFYPSLEPRLSVLLRPSRMLTVNASYSRMSQGEHLVTSSVIDMPGNFWMPMTEYHKPLKSDQFTVETQLVKAGVWKFSLGGYYKKMRNLYEYAGEASYIPPVDAWESSYVSGLGRSYGLESFFELTRKKIDVTVSYTLSWTQRNFKEFWRGWYYDRFDNRHNLNLNLVWHLHPLIDVYANWCYRSGNRLNIPSHLCYNIKYDGGDPVDGDVASVGEPNRFRMPDYHRLDVGIDFNAKTARRGRDYCVSFGIYNLYMRKNPMYVKFEMDPYRKPRLAYTAIYPIIPTIRYTYHF